MLTPPAAGPAGPSGKADGGIIEPKGDFEKAPAYTSFEKKFHGLVGGDFSCTLSPDEACIWFPSGSDGKANLSLRVEQAMFGNVATTKISTFIDWYKETEGIPIRLVWSKSSASESEKNYLDRIVKKVADSKQPNVVFDKPGIPYDVVFEVYLYDTSEGHDLSPPTFGLAPGWSEEEIAHFVNDAAYSEFRSDPHTVFLGKIKIAVLMPLPIARSEAVSK